MEKLASGALIKDRTFVAHLQEIFPYPHLEFLKVWYAIYLVNETNKYAIGIIFYDEVKFVWRYHLSS